MTPIHSNDMRFLCSRCKTPTKCKDLLAASEGPGREFSADCLHVETMRKIYAIPDTITDHNRRSEGPPSYIRLMEDHATGGNAE